MAEQTTSTSGTTTSDPPNNGQSATLESFLPDLQDRNDLSDNRTESIVPMSCTKAFDSVYFCYSPFHQARHYYIEGQLDDCRGRLRRFRLCLLARLKPHGEAERMFHEENQRESKAKNLDKVQPVWTIRPEFLESVRRAEEQESNNEDDQGKHNASWWL